MGYYLLLFAFECHCIVLVDATCDAALSFGYLGGFWDDCLTIGCDDCVSFVVADFRTLIAQPQRRTFRTGNVDAVAMVPFVALVAV